MLRCVRPVAGRSRRDEVNVVLWVWKVFGSTRLVFAVVGIVVSMVLIVGLATVGLAALSSDDEDKNRINCSGVSWDTPFELKGVNYLERWSKAAKELTDGKDSPKDAYLFVRVVSDVTKLWKDAIWGPLFGDVKANKAVTGYRNTDERAREKALRFCCVQLRKFQGEDGTPVPKLKDDPQPKVEPGPGEAPWGPKSASLQNPSRATGRFNEEQMDIARVTRQVAVDHGIPERGVLVALAAGFVESGVANLNYGDRDSVGWLQQRPSSGWGTVAQIRNPELAAEAFFGVAKHTHNRGLTDIRGWQSRSIGSAAQAVQVSAFPSKYAGEVGNAKSLLAAVGGMKATSRSVALSDPKAKKPVFDPTVPLEGYCSKLEQWDAGTGGADLAEPKSFGGGPVPADFDRQGNPRTVEQAVAIVSRNAPSGFPNERVSGMCERFVTLAYGHGGGYPTANAHWYAPGPKSTTGVPPRGALVFWRTSNPAGHVALSLGNGIVASTDFNSRTGRFQSGVVGIGSIDQLDKWGPRLGWRAPNFRIGSEGANV